MMHKEQLNYTLVRPQEVRQRFTEFVLRNQTKALINTSLISANESHYFGVNDSMLKSGGLSKKKIAKGSDKINESSVFMNTVGLKDAYGEESK